MTNPTIQHAQAFSESQIYAAWGQGPSARYDELAQHFRPVFAKIQAGTLQREQQRILPYEQLQWLKDSGFTRLRLPKAFGGFDATIPELFALLVELAQADSNLPQALRVHVGFTEDVLISKDPAFKARWLKRIAAGEIVGSAWSEGGKESRLNNPNTLLIPNRQKLKFLPVHDCHLKARSVPVWRIILSDPLQIVALVSLYLTN